MLGRLPNRIAALLLACSVGQGAALAAGPPCPWDLDSDGTVGVLDFLELLASWGPNPGHPADFDNDGIVGVLDFLELLANWGPCPPPTGSFFGHYTGIAVVTESAYYPPGEYAAEAALAQSASGVVGFLNIVFDPQDPLGGTFTHAFSARLDAGAELFLKYSDRMCGAGDPIGMCYPHYADGYTQYSFRGIATLGGDQLFLDEPTLIPGLPYAATLPFESAELTRTPRPPRDTFNGTYPNLEYIWMGTVLFPLPLPLYGNNVVEIADGEIVEWINNGLDVPLAGEPGTIIAAWCFDDARNRGWMNQQGEWFYDWLLDPGGAGVSVIVTFAGAPPDCRDLADPLAGDGLDLVHQNLAGILFELP